MKTYTPALDSAVRDRLRDYATLFADDFPQAQPARWTGASLQGRLLDGERKSIEPLSHCIALPQGLTRKDPEQTGQQSACGRAAGRSSRATNNSRRRRLGDREAGLAQEGVPEQRLVPLGIITVLIAWPHHLSGGRVDHAGQLHGAELLPSVGRVYT